jgi:hypothetical protein
MQPEIIREIEKNIFPPAHASISDWDTFPWHMSKGRTDTDRIQSSQALAIDVMGTLQTSPCRNAILNFLAARINVPVSEKWEIILEWQDDENLLNEPSHRTQVDAVAISETAMILFECKFKEGGGGCSQTLEIASGAKKRTRQCDRKYHLQENPSNKRVSRCALTGKEIKYWRYIPEVFNFDPEQDYYPCPFVSTWYQYMRNLVLASALRERTKKHVAFVLLFADHYDFPTKLWLQSEDYSKFEKCLRNDGIPFSPLSFQHLVSICQQIEPHEKMWKDLKTWVDHKICNAAKNL